MEFIPDQLREQADKIARGEDSDTITVRTLVKWFGAERRGFNVVWGIRKALKEVGLTTRPDFNITWLDGHIAFEAIEPEPESVPTAEAAVGSTGPAERETTPDSADIEGTSAT